MSQWDGLQKSGGVELRSRWKISLSLRIAAALSHADRGDTNVKRQPRSGTDFSAGASFSTLQNEINNTKSRGMHSYSVCELYPPTSHNIPLLLANNRLAPSLTSSTISTVPCTPFTKPTPVPA